MSGPPLDAVLARIADLARDTGYLRRRLDPESSAWWPAERVADGIESLDAMMYPCAAELRRDFFLICGDHDLAVEEALRVMDERAGLVRGLLRPKGCR